jgi:calcium-dependent protein kinase
VKLVFLGHPRLTHDAVKVLREEFVIMSALDHPNIVRVLDTSEDNVRRQLVIVEELCNGGTLLDALHQAGAISDRVLASTVMQLLAALQHMHSRGVLHRDLKPENIMLRTKCHDWIESVVVPVVIDFGMAAQTSPQVQLSGLMGSPGALFLTRCMNAIEALMPCWYT